MDARKALPFAAVLSTLVLATGLYAEDRAKEADRWNTARTSCESNSASTAYADPSDACWTAFDGARIRGAFEQARYYALLGCNLYGRPDFCLLNREIGDPARLNSTTVRALLARAELAVKAVDVEDAENGRRILADAPRQIAQRSR